MPAPSYVYHVTYYVRLSEIADEGLVPGCRRSIGAPGYDANCRDRIFLTVLGGVFYWFGKARDFAYNQSDNVLKDGLVPVVLRVRRFKPLYIDKLGTADAMAQALYAKTGVDPDGVELWSGSRWVPVAAWSSVDPKSGVRYEDEDGGYYTLLDWRQSPLFPPEASPVATRAARGGTGSAPTGSNDALLVAGAAVAMLGMAWLARSRRKRR